MSKPAQIKVEQEVTIRPRCPHDNKLLDKAGRCWACGKRPDEWKGAQMQTGNGKAFPEGYSADPVTGEIPGQLSWPIAPPIVTVRRREDWGITMEEFNGFRWEMDEGDSMRVKVKGGLWFVTISHDWGPVKE